MLAQAWDFSTLFKAANLLQGDTQIFVDHIKRVVCPNLCPEDQNAQARVDLISTLMFNKTEENRLR
jgi:hypothetical protein